ncbi:MAG TPA: hypothetical protein VGR07_14345 [Thermoanaerobaculia bacterium]|jgi:hypothetical protein|nr:hypothetical protein [Thermoanaerobaculia bacterium]
MKTLRTASLLTVFAAAALLTGCISAGVYDGDRDAYRRNDGSEVQGTVERVDPVNRRIVVAEGERTDDRYDRNDPRNGERYDRGDIGGRGGGREIAIYYDDRTVVEREGQTYRPQDLERGDQIRAEVERTDGGLMVQQIEVLSDVRGGPALEAPEAPAPEDRRAVEPLRGTVRSVDPRARILEIQTSSRSDARFTRRAGVVQVQYDADTDVQFQGRRYSPENLERGDRVEIDVRDLGGRLLAEQIVVVGEGQR